MTARDELAAIEIRLESRVHELRETVDPERKTLLAEMLELLVEKYRDALDRAIMNRVFD